MLKVLAKIPAADADGFERILRGSIEEGSWRDPVADDLRKLLFCGMDGMPAVRDLPDLFVSVAKEYLLASEEDVRNAPYSRSPLDLETFFGVKEARNHECFPPSAYRGPWYFFLQYHPDKAVDFYIELFNHFSDWYVHPRIHDRLEPAWEIKITLPNGSTKTHWGNERLWNLYRGTSVGPNIVQSILMALEKWLLDFAKKYPDEFDTILIDILRRTDSAMLAAVVSSGATAHPRISGEALLTLLSTPDYISLDRKRMVGEHQANSLLEIHRQGLQAVNKVHIDEREDSNRLPHRQRDLEAAIANLQLGPFAPRVHAAIDQHLAALPPKSEQHENDLVWRLSLHRMDLRQYTLSNEENTDIPEEDQESDTPSKRYILLEPRTPDEDVQAMIEENVDQQRETGVSVALLMWGIKIFERDTSHDDPSEWTDKLMQAKELEASPAPPFGGQNAPGFVAAVCIRDHWDEMASDDKAWCVDTVCSEIHKYSDNWSDLIRVQRFSMGADRPSASVVSALLTKSLDNEQMEKVRVAFITAITHPVEEVQWYAAWGVNEAFWESEPVLALRAVNAIAMEATLIDEAMETERIKPYEERLRYDKISAESAATIRGSFWRGGAIPEDAHTKLTASRGVSAKAKSRILAIFSHVPNNADAVAAYARTSQALVDAWNAEYDHDEHRDYHAELSLSQLVRSFVLRTSYEAALTILTPILEAVDHHPREVYSIVEGLTLAEDSNPNTDHYWSLWRLFANQVRHAKWLDRLEDEHPTGGGMLSAIFLTNYWKDNVRHWKSLEGHDDNVHCLFEDLPPTSVVLDRYMRFLYHIGERSLPAAFVRISKALERGNPQEMLKESNTTYILEVLLQRYIYGRPLELKRNATTRNAILFLLDTLVENGSSAAFRMRDDFVTPVS